VEVPMSANGEEEWIHLLGRPPFEEYYGFMLQADPANQQSLKGARELWRNAACAVDAQTATEGGIADQAAFSSLPQELVDRAEKYLQDPLVAGDFSIVPSTIEMVPLNKAIVFQKMINLQYAESLSRTLAANQSADDLFDFCLISDQAAPAISRMQVGNSFMFTSPSSDVRVLGATLVDASQILVDPPSGRARSAIVTFIGYGTNALSFAYVNGRLILANGSHRAYALMAAGYTHAPAVVQHIERPDDLQAIMPIAMQNGGLYLGHPRPPMLKDYFDDSVRAIVKIPRRNRQVKVQFGVEVLDAPA
jgi:hypothetical protein